MPGQLFTSYFLEEGILHTQAWQESLSQSADFNAFRNQAHALSPSLQSSRRPRRILLDCYHSPPAQSADEWLLNNPSMRCLIGAVNASCTTTTDNETHAQHIIATYPFPLPPNCPGAENQDRLAPRGAMFHSPISNASHRTVYISSLEC